MQLNRFKGFTLIELIVVLVIISLMATLSVPVVSTAVQRSKESALKENLLVTRRALDDYYADHGSYPDDLEVLVTKKYIRKLPVDPIMGDSAGWELISSADYNTYGIMDIKSSSSGQAIDGTYYNDW